MQEEQRAASTDPKDVPWHATWWARAARALTSALAVVIGVGIVLFTIAIGHCSAFGGRCPRDPAFQDDVFWSAAAGTAIAIGVPMILHRPSWRRLTLALIAAAMGSVLIGLFAVSVTAS